MCRHKARRLLLAAQIMQIKPDCLTEGVPLEVSGTDGVDSRLFGTVVGISSPTAGCVSSKAG